MIRARPGAPSRLAGWACDTVVTAEWTDGMRRARRAYAGSILLVPIPLVVFAVVRAIHSHGLGAAEIVPLVTMYFASQLGITCGYHRLASHASFRAHVFVEYALLIMGSMAGQGPLITWVANHRRHHQFADRPGDPHSPHQFSGARMGSARGLWHAHIGWSFTHELSNSVHYCRDLLASPRVRLIHRRYLTWVLLGLSIPALMGWAIAGTAAGALSGLLWGGFVRLLLAYQATLSINSLGHLLGSRSFATRDHSCNNLWLAIPTLGEGWHNNHHAFPTSAYFGLAWWQLDIGALVLRGLAAVGLVWGLRRPAAGAERRSPPIDCHPRASDVRVSDTQARGTGDEPA